MYRNMTSIKKSTITYEWIIQDFQVYVECFTDCSTVSTLKSPQFTLENGDNSIKFHLQLVFQIKNNADDNLSLLLSKDKSSDEATAIKLRIYTLNSNNERCNDISYPARRNTTNVELGQQSYLKIRDLFDDQREHKLLSNNCLTVGCDITIYDQIINTPSVYESTNYESMENQFAKLLESKVGCDFTFKVSDKEFQVHKAILMARSPVFQNMIENNETEITDIRADIFKIMLTFIYSDKINHDLNYEKAKLLLMAANTYQLHGLEEICSKSLFELIDVENVMETLTLADTCCISNLVASARNFVNANKVEIFNTIYYHKLHDKTEENNNQQK